MTEQKNGKFEMPALPYAAADLAPALSAETIEFHYGKHLQTYLNNLNAALPGSAFEGKSLEDIVKTSEGGVFNNAGQFLNHSMYFLQFAAPKAGNVPTGNPLQLYNLQSPLSPRQSPLLPLRIAPWSSTRPSPLARLPRLY